MKFATGFLQFLVNNNIYTVAIGNVVGVQIRTLATAILNFVIKPIIELFTKQSNLKLEDQILVIRGAKIEIGKLVLAIMEVTMVLLILYILVGYLPKTVVAA